MNRIERKFMELKASGRKAFIVYICAGDPDIATTKRLVLELENAHADIIELGVPFSDPLADGPTIQRASQRALKNGINLPRIFSMLRDLRRKTDIPLVLMTYYNPLYYYGVRRFVVDAKAAGADGVIVPDIPPEEGDELTVTSKLHEFDTVFLAAPTSTGRRIGIISKKSKGFIYYVSLTGVTGARAKLPPNIRAHICHIRRISRKPVCVGFGISTPAQVRALSRFCDGVIVGSAIVDKVEKFLSHKGRIPSEAARFVKGLIRGLD